MLAIWLQLHFKRPTFAGLRKNKKKENKGSQKKVPEKKWEKGCPLAKLDIA